MGVIRFHIQRSIEMRARVDWPDFLVTAWTGADTPAGPLELDVPVGARMVRFSDFMERAVPVDAKWLDNSRGGNPEMLAGWFHRGDTDNVRDLLDDPPAEPFGFCGRV